MHHTRYTELLCQCLASWNPILTSAAEKSLYDKQLEWHKFLLCADRHFILPSLFFSLSSSGLLRYLPKDLAEYLRAVWTLNRRRNRMMRQALISVCSRLNGIGITPVLLKGAAALTEEEDSGLFDRVMYDLDLFVPDGRSGEARDFLKEHGYTPLYDNEAFWQHHHHEVPLRHNKFPVSIELHRYILSLKKFNDVPISIRDGARTIQSGGADMLVPDVTFRVLHNFIDHSLHDGFFFQNRIDPKRLYESARLRTAQNQKIRYQQIQEYCREKGVNTAWLTYCLSGRRLFSCPVPCRIPKFSYAVYREHQIRFYSRLPFLVFARYWLQRGSRLPARLVTPSWYAVKFGFFLRT